MAQINISPFIIRDCLLKIGADSYEKHISKVQVDPQISQVSWQGGTPDSKFNDATITGYTVGIDYAQDWETPDSLAQYLWENKGLAKVIEFTPRNGMGQKITLTATILPGPFGGGVGPVAAGSVTLPVQGEPAISAVL